MWFISSGSLIKKIRKIFKIIAKIILKYLLPYIVNFNISKIKVVNNIKANMQKFYKWQVDSEWIIVNEKMVWKNKKLDDKNIKFIVNKNFLYIYIMKIRNSLLLKIESQRWM